MSNAHEAVEAYWTAIDGRNWGTLTDLLAENVVYEAPETRERVRGRAAFIRYNTEAFPGEDWHIFVERIIGAGRHTASWVQFSEVSLQPGLSFFDLNQSGQIERITDFWPIAYDPPAYRAQLVERY
jgi:SnoaL-like domain